MSQTQLEAYAKIRDKVGFLQSEVLKAIEAAPEGLTDWEIAEKLRKGHRQDVAPRRTELLKMNLIKDSGRTRYNALTKADSAVWVLSSERNLL